MSANVERPTLSASISHSLRSSPLRYAPKTHPAYFEHAGINVPQAKAKRKPAALPIVPAPAAHRQRLRSNGLIESAAPPSLYACNSNFGGTSDKS